MKVTVTLDSEDWQELVHVAGQGYGDGSVYDLDKPAKHRPPDWKKKVNRYFRARNGICRAIATAEVTARLKAEAQNVATKGRDSRG